MNVTFNGEVSAQAQAGEPVTITVTKPNNTTEDILTQTLADKTYTTSKEYSEAGNYKATAHGGKVVSGNTEYSAWATPEVQFSLVARTGTLVVVVA